MALVFYCRRETKKIFKKNEGATLLITSGFYKTKRKGKRYNLHRTLLPDGQIE